MREHFYAVFSGTATVLLKHALKMPLCTELSHSAASWVLGSPGYDDVSCQWFALTPLSSLWPSLVRVHIFLQQVNWTKLESGFISPEARKVCSFSFAWFFQFQMRACAAPAMKRAVVPPAAESCHKADVERWNVIIEKHLNLWYCVQVLKNVISSKKFANINGDYFIWLNISLNHMSTQGLLKRKWPCYLIPRPVLSGRRAVPLRVGCSRSQPQACEWNLANCLFL